MSRGRLLFSRARGFLRAGCWLPRFLVALLRPAVLRRREGLLLVAPLPVLRRVLRPAVRLLLGLALLLPALLLLNLLALVVWLAVLLGYSVAPRRRPRSRRN